MKSLSAFHILFASIFLGCLSVRSVAADDLCNFSLDVMPPSSCFSCEVFDNSPALADVRAALQKQLVMTERKFSAVRELLVSSNQLSDERIFHLRQKVKVLDAVAKSNLSILQSMLDEVPASVSSCSDSQAFFCSAIDYSSVTAGIVQIANILHQEVLLKLVEIQRRLKKEHGERYQHRLQRSRANSFFEAIVEATTHVNTVHVQCGDPR